MRTDVPQGKPVSIFLFAHQDDECGVYEQIHLALGSGHRVVCAYLTTGVPPGGDSSRRDGESLAVLGKLGVDAQDVILAGTQLDIPDGALLNRLHSASIWLTDWLAGFDATACLYVPAWEGGHPDHDALHAMVVQLCSDTNRLSQVFQYALYNGFRCPRPWFRLFSPLPANGPVARSMVPWRRRLRFAHLALGYPSQWRTWIGLFPFFVLHHGLYGWQALQPVDLGRVRERPHGRRLYYEMRQFSSWETVSSSLEEWTMTRPSLQHL